MFKQNIYANEGKFETSAQPNIINIASIVWFILTSTTPSSSSKQNVKKSCQSHHIKKKKAEMALDILVMLAQKKKSSMFYRMLTLASWKMCIKSKPIYLLISNSFWSSAWS